MHVPGGAALGWVAGRDRRPALAGEVGWTSFRPWINFTRAFQLAADEPGREILMDSTTGLWTSHCRLIRETRV